MAQGLKDLLEATRDRIREIGVDEAKARMTSNSGVLFLDVRETIELSGGRIPGSLHIPRGVLEPKAAHDSPAREAELSDTEREVIVYCASGVRSALAADSLQNLGFRNVWSLSGGFGAWKNGGLPVE